MDNKEKEDILERYYFDEKNPAAYAGAQKLFRVLDDKYPGIFSVSYVKQWLNDQDAYSLQKPRRHKFKKANVRVTAIGEQLDIDLLSMFNIADENDGVRYLLCAIDILSRKLWVKPLKNKTAKEVLNATKDMMIDISPIEIRKVRADKGSEFSNQWFRKYMKNLNIHFFTTNNSPKSNFVERVQRTLKERLYRMMRHKRTYRYIDDLQNVVVSYNTTPHRGLHGLAPNDVNKSNEADVWAKMYLKKSNKPIAKPNFHFKNGDLVRISFTKQPFQRAYQEQYTTEVFKVSGRILKQAIPMYKLKDLKGDRIQGLFYTAELQKVNKDENSLWFIESILKKRKRNRRREYFVKWQGFPKTFNSWVDADDVEDVAWNTK
ncbi:uncharacterized protein LOC128230882 [Mya arenaria]|uniref:uncharacterized protein LOC128208487 n=1 Tax=Mya arenaria TaxID=6604 RepID=UPI0022E39C2E|nr:uncharacterized protein LOC128208487 [Mya arenaria]XP_052799270.1 uncharacterized protein LOC128230882 [Mya arenaria]